MLEIHRQIIWLPDFQVLDWSTFNGLDVSVGSLARNPGHDTFGPVVSLPNLVEIGTVAAPLQQFVCHEQSAIFVLILYWMCRCRYLIISSSTLGQRNCCCGKTEPHAKWSSRININYANKKCVHPNSIQKVISIIPIHRCWFNAHLCRLMLVIICSHFSCHKLTINSHTVLVIIPPSLITCNASHLEHYMLTFMVISFMKYVASTVEGWTTLTFLHVGYSNMWPSLVVCYPQHHRRHHLYHHQPSLATNTNS